MDVAAGGGARGVRRGIVTTASPCRRSSPLDPLEILSFLRARPEASGGYSGDSVNASQGRPGAPGSRRQATGSGPGTARVAG